MRIFALTLLCSTVLIQNLSKQVQEDNLQSAAMYSSFAKLVRSQTDAPRLGFHTLFFAVRDWQFDDDDDVDDDDAYLAQILRPKGDADLDGTREALASTFDHMHAALLCHPGRTRSRTAPTHYRR